LRTFNRNCKRSWRVRVSCEKEKKFEQKEEKVQRNHIKHKGHLAEKKRIETKEKEPRTARRRRIKVH
jgi:hypothetical protein